MKLGLDEPLFQGLGIIVFAIVFFKKYIIDALELVQTFFGVKYFFVIPVFTLIGLLIIVYFFRDRRQVNTCTFVLVPRKTSFFSSYRTRLEEVLSRVSKEIGVDVKSTYIQKKGENTLLITVSSPSYEKLLVVSSIIKSYGDVFDIRQTRKNDSIVKLFDNERNTILSDKDELFFACDTRTNHPISLSEEDLWRHIGVFGATGSGKTTTVAILSKLFFLKKSIPVVIFDWHGEYKDLLKDSVSLCYIEPLKDRFSVNPLRYRDHESVMNVFEDVFSLSAPQYSFLFRLLKENSVGTLHELLYFIDSMETEGYWERELKHALVRKMEFVDSREGRILFSNEHNRIVFSTPCIFVIDLGGIRSYRLRKLYVLSFLRDFYEDALEGGSKNRFVIVLDEAHNILPKDTDNFLSRMIAEVRKFGIGFIVSTQSPSSINVEFLKNLNTKIIHSIKNSVDKTVILESIPYDREVEEYITRLLQGEAIFSSSSSPSSSIVRICKNLLYASDIDCSDC